MAIKVLVAIIALCVSLEKARGLEYKNREHEWSEIAYDQGMVFAFHLFGYVATQYKSIQERGSFEGYKDRFFRFDYDPNNPAWNLVGHTLTGSQVYLFYRARAYSRQKSFFLSALSSLYFEILLETYTERPSAQDTFNTPVFGSILGHWLEGASISLMESDSPTHRALGRIINPFSFLVEDGQNMTVVPLFNAEGFQLVWSAAYD